MGALMKLLDNYWIFDINQRKVWYNRRLFPFTIGHGHKLVNLLNPFAWQLFTLFFFPVIATFSSISAIKQNGKWNDTRSKRFYVSNELHILKPILHGQYNKFVHSRDMNFWCIWTFLLSIDLSFIYRNLARIFRQFAFIVCYALQLISSKIFFWFCLI